METSSESIKASVVIPAYNEEKYLAACFECLQRQDFNQAYEVIVVDNASVDKTSQIAQSFGAKVVTEPHRGITWARQKGLEVARGEVIACVDADTYVAADWLKQLCKTPDVREQSIGAE